MSRSRIIRAATAVGFEGDLVRVRFAGRPLWVTVRVHIHEHVRRLAAGVGAITNRSIVNALWELPHHEEIPVKDVPDWVIKRLGQADREIVVRTGRGITRTIQLPVEITGALAFSTKLRPAMSAVGALSAIAPMAVVTRGPIATDHPDYLDAQLFGMGVLTEVDRYMYLEIPPERADPLIGAFQWWAAEVAYSGLLEIVRAGPPTA